MYTVASPDPDPNPRGMGQLPNPNDMAPGWSARILYGRHGIRIRHALRRPMILFRASCLKSVFGFNRI